MGWVRIDDAFYDHPKFAQVGVLGLAAWVAGLAYANRNLTDGFIPGKAARHIIDTDGLAVYEGNFAGRDAQPRDGVEQLVTAGLWEQVDGGYEIHDYLDYQPSAEAVRLERAKTAERVRNWRGRRPDDAGNADGSACGNAVSDGETNAVSNDCSNAVTNGVSDGVGTAAPNPKVTPIGVTTGPKPKRSRPRTAPPDLFPVTAELREWAATNSITADLDRETAQWLDWHRGKGTLAADWVASWRTWMRNTLKFDRPAQAVNGSRGWDGAVETTGGWDV